MAENETDPLVLADQGLADLQQLLTAATGIMGAVHQATEAAVLEARKTHAQHAETAERSEAHQAAMKLGMQQYAQARSSLARVLELCSTMPAPQVSISGNGPEAESEEVAAQRQRLELRLQELKEEAVRKNAVLKGLIDQMRELLGDVHMWRLTDAVPGGAIHG